MKHKVLLSISWVLLMLAPALAQAQDGWDKYQSRTLGQIIKQHSAAVDDKARIHLLFTADVFPSRVKVTYTGELRSISSVRKEFIANWAKTRKVGEELVDLFQEELLFREGTTEYWLPVQKQVVPYFKQELKIGDQVELYLIWIGARREFGVADWIFLVNEFEHGETVVPAAEQALGADSPVSGL
jgi:hypothetical protein